MMEISKKSMDERLEAKIKLRMAKINENPHQPIKNRKNP